MHQVENAKPTDIFGNDLILVWNKKVPNTHLEKFQKAVEKQYNQHFETYFDFHKWSTDNFPCFWEEVWKYMKFIHSESYDEVYRRTGETIFDCEWFPGAKFNFAENILRTRDDTLAIIYADEYGNEERVTFSEMFEDIKLYVAAFRKNGLKVGDRVACYMSNRKETMYALLATTSIGAIFGGSQPFYGPKPASKIIQGMEPKFLIAVDHHQDMGVEFHNIDNLPEIIKNSPTLEHVIIVPTKPGTKTRDISNIRNSCLLEDFLRSGRREDGKIPDLVFEQLPFCHPICINFTSGTTGLPKGPVHSAGSLLSHLVDLTFYMNLDKGDVLFACIPFGWSLWDSFIPCLARGVTLVLYAGSTTYERKGSNVWDILTEFKVTHTFMGPAFLDKFEKNNVLPRPNANLKDFKFLAVGGSPVKTQNYLFLRNKIKNDIFIGSQYGATETFGTFSGFNLNMPYYAGEIQIPALGMDVRCFDEKGNTVVNKRGDMVLAKPSPSLPIYIWKDKDNTLLKETYFSKYPGVWCQHDEIWINPKTKGFVVLGRSDDTLKNDSQRFSTADIYTAIYNMEEVEDSICVGQQTQEGKWRAVLFVKMKQPYAFTMEITEKIKRNINEKLWRGCIPQVILEAKDIPYNLNNKKMESVVRKIIAANIVPDVNSIKNPECLYSFCNIPEIINY